ncbi:hypothetical protein R4Z09_07575 [Niallia oryzisoli]|uniref:Uncharacterized protein n=1 Tax=Niallia oryzisoli TaxID=1737571 RepID=A0ABZ2CGC5_9BACI
MTLRLPKKVTIIEVDPRDSLQNKKTFFLLQLKFERAFYCLYLLLNNLGHT